MRNNLLQSFTYTVNDRIQGIGKVLEQQILELNRHSKDTIKKFGHVIVAFVHGQHSWHVFILSNKPDADEAIGNI